MSRVTLARPVILFLNNRLLGDSLDSLDSLDSWDSWGTAAMSNSLEESMRTQAAMTR
jgi:hypothetical protein